jgi:hypothetical protein
MCCLCSVTVSFGSLLAPPGDFRGQNISTNERNAKSFPVVSQRRALYTDWRAQMNGRRACSRVRFHLRICFFNCCIVKFLWGNKVCKSFEWSSQFFGCEAIFCGTVAFRSQQSFQDSSSILWQSWKLFLVEVIALGQHLQDGVIQWRGE